jgi:Ca2+/H+ antiporter
VSDGSDADRLQPLDTSVAPSPSEILDLTTRPGEQEASRGLNQPEEKPYDPAPERERKRGLIALVLVSALCGIIVLAFAFVFVIPRTTENVEALKSLPALIFAPIVGLVGAVTGFYFGEKSR